MKIYLIRHAMTEGNLKKRYIGTTDEPLCKEGIELLRENLEKGMYPKVDRIFVSPMCRCMQTAGILYPMQDITLINDLAECDFGIFEDKNYEELKDEPRYQEWVDSGGTLPFPEGESVKEFKERSLSGFMQALARCEGEEKIALIVHGGTIMSIMERYATPKKGYYDYQIENGEGYELILDTAAAGSDRISNGSHSGGSRISLSSGTVDRTLDNENRKNYKKLSS